MSLAIANYSYKRFTCQSELLDKLSELTQAGQGFWRLADQDAAVWLDNEPLKVELAESFLFECAFFVEGIISISVKQFDDFWEYSEVQWKDTLPSSSTPEDDFHIYELLAADESGYKKLRFCTKFAEKPLPIYDSSGNISEDNSLSVLQTDWKAFVGFA